MYTSNMQHFSMMFKIFISMETLETFDFFKFITKYAPRESNFYLAKIFCPFQFYVKLATFLLTFHSICQLHVNCKNASCSESKCIISQEVIK
jgi:hypothetical protein